MRCFIVTFLYTAHLLYFMSVNHNALFYSLVLKNPYDFILRKVTINSDNRQQPCFLNFLMGNIKKVKVSNARMHFSNESDVLH